MDFDANLFLNFVPVISASVLTFITCVTVFCKLRDRWPTKVNCWFCNGNAKVQRRCLDWWLCPHCDQYNGFDQDGDYNYEIPEQHKIANRNAFKHKSYCQRKEFSKSRSSLCKECNRKEELKLMALRELEDSMDVYNDKQIARFERNFEKKYPLCLKCQSIVKTVLYKQTLWLTQYKMLLFKQKPIKSIIENRERIERILRIVLTILASVAIYFTEVWYLPLCGIFFQLAACLASPNNNRQSDIFPLLGWACLIWVRAFSTTAILKMFKIYSNIEWTSVNDDTYKYFIITLGSAVGLANLKFRSHKTISSGSLTFKKLESPNGNISTSCSPSPETHPSLFTKDTTCNKEPIRNLYSPVNITDNLLTPAVVETPVPLKPTNVFQRSFDDNRAYSPSISSRASNYFDTDTTFVKTYSLNDSLTSLNSLHLGGTRHHRQISPSSSCPPVFETKIYGTSSPDLFHSRSQRNSTSSSSRRAASTNILAPPRLRSVTQTSWVAGGYWQQSGLEALPPTLSRSSSQSSGIGSTGSQCGGGPSREPSVHEFDQCSVLSDCFARPESPVRRRRDNTCSPRCSGGGGGSLQGSETGSKCAGHHTTTTVIANPVWLSVLLCGSLVFNMIVLCTILTR